jgi:hypothetical protein
MQLGDVKKIMQTVKDMDQDYLKQWIDALKLGAVFARAKG